MDNASAIFNLRKSLGLSLADFGTRIGVASKGRVSEIERGVIPCPQRVALNIEQLSAGAINAADLNDAVRAARSIPSDFNGHNDTVVEARTVLCATCELRTDDPATASCTFIDCPHSQRQAA